MARSQSMGRAKRFGAGACLEFEPFQACLANLRSERHGAILVNERRRWTGFREAIMRGCVRLMAEAGGVAIAV